MISNTKNHLQTIIMQPVSEYRPHQSEVMSLCLCALMDECLGEGMFCWCCEEADGGVSHAN